MGELWFATKRAWSDRASAFVFLARARALGAFSRRKRSISLAMSRLIDAHERH
jgi:hypothetical protein